MLNGCERGFNCTCPGRRRGQPRKQLLARPDGLNYLENGARRGGDGGRGRRGLGRRGPAPLIPLVQLIPLVPLILGARRELGRGWRGRFV